MLHKHKFNFTHMFEEMSSTLRIWHQHNSAFACFSARVLLAQHADFHIIKIAGFESEAVAESPGSTE